MMQHVRLLWDWNTLDSVRAVHSFFEISALVFFALLVLFDVLAHLADDKPREKSFERIGLVFFGIAVVCEIFALPYSKRNDQLSGNEIRQLSEVSQQARTDATTAITRAQSAMNESTKAKSSADDAEGRATQANELARGARREADSFERRIVSATDTAIKAESHLADALEHTARIERQLAWRTINSDQRSRIAAKLSRFTGQLFDITTFESEPECVNFENELYSNVLAGKWLLDPKREWHALMGMVVGVRLVLSVDAPSQTRTAADGMIKALQDESIETSIIYAGPKDTWPAPSVVALQVGKNPNSTRPIIPVK